MEGISFDFLADLTLGIVILSNAWRKVGPELSVNAVLYFFTAVLGGWGVLTGVFLSLTSLSFWSEDRTSIMPPVYNLFNFARYPLDIYRPFIRILLTWVIPFGFVAFYPSAGLLPKGQIFHHLSVFAPAVGLFMLSLGGFIWSRGVRRYSGAGS
jgi:ABC-2 type transport system permease protein